MKAFPIAQLTFQEAARKRVFLGAAALTLGFLALFTLGSHFAFQDLDRRGAVEGLRNLARSQLLLAGLYITNFMGGLLAVFASVGAISSEIDQGTLHAIVPKPLNRWEILLGKWLGYAIMLFIYILVTASLVLSAIYFTGGFLPGRAFIALLLMAFQALLLLSVCLLGSTFLSMVTNGVVVLILYATAITGGMVEQLGALLQNDTMVNIGIVTSLIMPTDALWKLASHQVQAPLSLPLEGGGPFGSASPPSAWMALYAALYILAAFGLASWIFQRRDL